MAKKKTFIVLDGNSLLHRAWHAIPPLAASDGRIVNAAYGFTNVIEKMLTEWKPDYMAVAWDLPGKTFRHEAYAEYKGTRKKKEQELYDQIDFIKDILTAYGIPSLSAEGMEGDDVVGTLAKKYGPKADTKVLLLSGDLDTLQLVDKDVEVLVFIKGLSVTKTYDTAAVQERYELHPDQLIDLKAMMGDSSDNIPGLAGVGKKTATNLLKEHGSIEGIYKAINADKVPEKFAKKFIGQEETLEHMKMLVTILQDVKLPGFKISDAKVGPPNKEDLINLFHEFGFRRLLAKYEGGVEEKSESSASDGKSKTGAKAVDASKLGADMLLLHIDSGQQDLFGGAIREVVLYDGKKHASFSNPSDKDLKQILSLLNAAKLVIGQDLKASMHLLGEVTVPVFDTMVGAYLLSSGSRNFDLATSAYEHLGLTLKDDMSAADRAQVTFRLYKQVMKGLKEEGMEKLWQEIEMPLVRVLYLMEKEGILLDQKRLAKLSIDFEAELNRLTKKIHKLAGREFNINSPSQLAVILFEDLALPTKGIKKTKTGFSTAASELEKLADAHEIVPLMGGYREFAKLKSTYVDALPKLVADDGRIHTDYNQTITATGRLSSKNPNLQNIPVRTKLGVEIRKAFVSPKGKTLLAADYSQFELRLAASMAKDTSFIKAFQDGSDIHSLTASQVLDKDIKDVSKEERSAAKAINFGILYGMGVRNLAKSTGFSKDEAKSFLETYFEKHPQIQEYIDAMKLKAHTDEYVETLFGRRRYLPDVNSSMHMLVAAAERMAVNMPVQGTQADLVKMAMLKVQDWIEGAGLDVKMLLQVHDELVFEIADKDMEKAVPEIKKIMEAIWPSDVPLVVDAEVGKNWGDLKDWE